MAVTNRAKDQTKPPAWAQRGKLRLAHVPGGPSEAARMILSGQWDGSPSALLCVSRYGPQLVDELAAAGINAVALTWSPGFSHEGDQAQWLTVKAMLPLLKKKRIKTVAAVSLGNAFWPEGDRQPIPEQPGIGVSPPPPQRVPQAQAWLLRDAQGQVIFFDDARRCAALDLSNAECRAYSGHKIRSAVEAGFDGLLFEDVCAVEPSCAAAISAVNDAAALARACRQPGADDLLLCSDFMMYWPLAETGNFIHGCAGAAPGFGADGTLYANVEIYKLLFELGGRGRPFSHGLPSFTGAPAGNRTNHLAMAEVLAAGGVYHDFGAPLQYRRFQADHAGLFGDADPMNSIGVFYNDLRLNAGLAVGETLGLVLARHNIQFDVIPVSRFEHFDLRKYRLLCGMGVDVMPDELLTALAAFARDHGGTVLASAGTGLFGPDGRKRERPALFAGEAAAEERVERAAGDGRVIIHIPREDWFEANGVRIRAEATRPLVADVLKYGGPPPIEIQAPDGLIALLWGKGTRRWVHLLNYRAGPCDATVTLPGCGGRTITAYSPDDQQPVLNVLETGQARAGFALTGIQTYAVVEVV